MREIVLKANAKINLNLDITGVRDNGYHDVDMIMQQIDLYDWISLRESNNGINLRISREGLPTDERNIAYKAAKLIIDTYHEKIKQSSNSSQMTPIFGVEIYIHKFIPIAAGMAGGSTDAAAVLIGINQLYNLGFSTDELCEMGLILGADVPFCIRGGCMRACGIGEVMTATSPLCDCFICIAKPSFGISTKDAYKKYDLLNANENVIHHPDMDSMLQALSSRDLHKITSCLGNVLEQVALMDYPIIADIKNTMINNGALGALMTGSGPTVFGIFDDEAKAMATRELLFNMQFGKQIYVVAPINTESTQ